MENKIAVKTRASPMIGTSINGDRRVTRSMTAQAGRASPRTDKMASGQRTKTKTVRKIKSKKAQIRTKLPVPRVISSDDKSGLIRKVMIHDLYAVPSGDRYGLIQEVVAHDLYALLVQTVLWNQTTGRQARPVLEALLKSYPDAAALAAADVVDLTDLLQPIGLHNVRAKRLLLFAQTWVASPPNEHVVYRRKGYPLIPPGKAAVEVDQDFEVAHLPGIGPYAIDSYRMFHRDELRGLAKNWLGAGAHQDGFEPEWKRVFPTDKELRAWLKWRWALEGYDWSATTGKATRLQSS